MDVPMKPSRSEASRNVGAFLAEIAAGDPAGDRVAAAAAKWLTGITDGALPAGADVHWREVARLLKSPAGKALSPNSFDAIRSWPAARVSDLVGHIRSLHGVLEHIENERWEDSIRDKLRGSYL